jgi:hypothetical protein
MLARNKIIGLTKEATGRVLTNKTGVAPRRRSTSSDRETEEGESRAVERRWLTEEFRRIADELFEEMISAGAEIPADRVRLAGRRARRRAGSCASTA